MINVVRFNVLFLFCALVTFSSVGQDILHLRKGGEKRIIFDAEDHNSLTYRDYDDPDFKQVTERKKLYSKVVLANGKTVWLTQRDNYFRCKLGMNIGVASPLGDFASTDPNNGNAGFALSGIQYSGNLDVNVYKFVGLRVMGFYSNGSLSDSSSYYNNTWSVFGGAVGPEFHIKLSPRFYASIPVLFAGTNTYYYFNSTGTSIRGEGNGMGFITGLGLHARLGQHLAIGFTSQYFHQNVSMDFEKYDEIVGTPSNPYSSNVASSYSGDYIWAYLSNSVSFTIHF